MSLCWGLWTGDVNGLGVGLRKGGLCPGGDPQGLLGCGVSRGLVTAWSRKVLSLGKILGPRALGGEPAAAASGLLVRGGSGVPGSLAGVH